MTIRVGLIGCGQIAGWHARGYLTVPEEVQVAAVSDVVEANAQKMAQEVGGARIYNDYHALIRES